LHTLIETANPEREKMKFAEAWDATGHAGGEHDARRKSDGMNISMVNMGPASQ
jgi:hypothetical protein